MTGSWKLEPVDTLGVGMGMWDAHRLLVLLGRVVKLAMAMMSIWNHPQSLTIIRARHRLVLHRPVAMAVLPYSHLSSSQRQDFYPFVPI